ncbi:MAG: hypothetical protein ACKO1U_03870 [Bacteroidota bacterium]
MDARSDVGANKGDDQASASSIGSTGEKVSAVENPLAEPSADNSVAVVESDEAGGNDSTTQSQRANSDSAVSTDSGQENSSRREAAVTADLPGREQSSVSTPSKIVSVTPEDVAAMRKSSESYDAFESDESDDLDGLSPASEQVVVEREATAASTIDDSIATSKAERLVAASVDNRRKADLFDRQSTFLQQRVSELPEGEERDSVLQLSYEFSSEATRLYSLSDRQLSAARTTDLATVQKLTGAERLEAMDEPSTTSEIQESDIPTADALAVTDRINRTREGDANTVEGVDAVNDDSVANSEIYKTAENTASGDRQPASKDESGEEDAGFSIPIRVTDQTKYSVAPKAPATVAEKQSPANSASGATAQKSSAAPRANASSPAVGQNKTTTSSSERSLAATSDRASKQPATGSKSVADKTAVSSATVSAPKRATEAAMENEKEDAQRTRKSEGVAVPESAPEQGVSTQFASEQDEQRYRELNEQAEAGRQATIDAFSEAVRLNKEAVTARETYLATLKAADEATDSVRRIELLGQAETLKELSVANEEAARRKYQEAQKMTSEVEAMTQEAQSLTINNPQAPVAGSSGLLVTDEMATTEIGGEPLVLKSTIQDGVAAYTPEQPIPRDPPLPQGLVFKVQIGAFRKPIPESTFGGLRPLTAENSRPGWIRYCIGVFRAFEPANLVKKEMRRIGFKDAFVVAYLDGKRVSLSQAYSMINNSGSLEKTAYASASREETAELRKLDIVASRYPKGKDADEQGFFGTTEPSIGPAGIASAETTTGAIEYAVQVGVYKTDVAPAALAPLQPLQTEIIRERLYRFTSGRFVDYQSADSMRSIAIQAGVKDAFIVAYKDGNRIAIPADARKKPVQQVVKVAAPPPPTVDANITESPGPLMDQQGVVYRVQIGAFRQNVPFDVVDAFLKISDQGIDREKDERGLQIFYAGKYTDFNAAVAAKEQAVQRGVKDAFVVAFQDGKRISLVSARKGSGR